MSISFDTIKAVQQSIMSTALDTEAVLGGFSAVNAMHVPGTRGTLPYIKVIALHAPRDVEDVDAYAKGIADTVNAAVFFQPGEKCVVKSPFKGGFWCVRIISSKADVRLVEVATIAPFPALPFLPLDISLDEVTWNLEVMAGGRKWAPRVLLPSVFHAVLQASNSTHVLATFDGFLADGLLLEPPADKETALESKWIEDDAPPVAAPAIPRTILRRAASTGDASTSDAVVFPTAATLTSPPDLDAAPGVPDIEAFHAGLREASATAWTAAAQLAETLIVFPKLPRIQVTTPDINVLALAELHAAAHAAHTTHFPTGPALDAYTYASNMLPHGRYAFWALLNLLFAIPAAKA